MTNEFCEEAPESRPDGDQASLAPGASASQLGRRVDVFEAHLRLLNAVPLGGFLKLLWRLSGPPPRRRAKCWLTDGGVSQD